MKLHDHFEWDEDKADKNLKKHHVSFDDAASVLADEDGNLYHVEEFDDKHPGDEDRYVTTAAHPDDRRIVLLVVWTDRSTETERVTRIISARPATRRESQNYAKEIRNR